MKARDDRTQRDRRGFLRDKGWPADCSLYGKTTGQMTVRSLRRWMVCGLAVLASLMAAGASRAGQAVHEVPVVASRFQFAPARIVVAAGEPVRLVIRSSEGSHGFAIPALKIDGHVAKSGEPLVIEFTAPAAGTYEIACSEFCGSGHGHMKAALVSVAGPARNP